MLKFHLFPRDLEKMPSWGTFKTARGPRLLRSLRPSGSFGYALGRHLFQNPSEKGGISAQNSQTVLQVTQISPHSDESLRELLFSELALSRRLALPSDEEHRS